jgi:FkbH-like protein
VGDLQRAEELTRRTHQLNTTGYTYNYDELKAFIESDDHELWIASLEDRNGTFGKIGLCLLERSPAYWTIKLLLMSCRVMSYGIGTIMIGHAIGMAKQAGVTLRAEFVRTDRNRMMLITYRLGNFKVVHENGHKVLLENDCSVVQAFPSYVTVRVN